MRSDAHDGRVHQIGRGEGGHFSGAFAGDGQDLGRERLAQARGERAQIEQYGGNAICWRVAGDGDAVQPAAADGGVFSYNAPLYGSAATGMAPSGQAVGAASA